MALPAEETAEGAVIDRMMAYISDTDGKVFCILGGERGIAWWPASSDSVLKDSAALAASLGIRITENESGWTGAQPVGGQTAMIVFEASTVAGDDNPVVELSYTRFWRAS